MPKQNNQSEIHSELSSNNKTGLFWAIFGVLILLSIIVGVFLVISQKLRSNQQNVSQNIYPSQNNSQNYYDLLVQECQKCQKYSVNDCLKSVEIMRKYNYHEPDSQGKCPSGYRKNTLRCPCCFTWCEPEPKNN